MKNSKRTTTINNGDRAFTSHGEGTYKRTLGGHEAPSGHIWLLESRDEGYQVVSLWTVGGECINDDVQDPSDPFGSEW